jgi:hypothetical protein
MIPKMGNCWLSLRRRKRRVVQGSFHLVPHFEECSPGVIQLNLLWTNLFVWTNLLWTLVTDPTFLLDSVEINKKIG